MQEWSVSEKELFDKAKARSCFLEKVKPRVIYKRYSWDHGNVIFQRWAITVGKNEKFEYELELYRD